MQKHYSERYGPSVENVQDNELPTSILLKHNSPPSFDATTNF